MYTFLVAVARTTAFALLAVAGTFDALVHLQRGIDAQRADTARIVRAANARRGQQAVPPMTQPQNG